MAGVKITKTVTVDLGITGPTAGDLIRDSQPQVPEDAKYSVKAYKADPRISGTATGPSSSSAGRT